ncbi:F-box protein SKIP19-like [Populus alba x Populus x berolinensis]|uniref:F-box protein SKIP19-like n=1 Tax=Populus alba x Populus x berolinensis TaxID=444605 RepID=A0AAD6M7D3_9ROSI|nr:F-box protein SKIP19-like [Populus alba x Populus x berolinensis]
MDYSHSPARTLGGGGEEEEVGIECGKWVELPEDVMASILKRVGAIGILANVERVCKTWRNICKEPSMWRSIDMRNLGDIWDMDYDMVKICRHAVDRSSGALLHINIEYFGTDDLLLYIADRSTQLKSLRLVFCQNISDEGLIAAASKIPLLEELDLSYCSFSKAALEKVGHCCPLLRSFKLNTTGYRYPCIECDDEALAVAESMPGLRHLQMFGNKLTNDGLQAILDACLYLESLDLRRCFNVIVEGQMGRRCSERIKDLRQPNDSTDDYPFDSRFPHILWSDEEDYPCRFSDIDFMSDDDNYEFSFGSNFTEAYDEEDGWLF